MKALRSHEPGGPETLTLEELPDPVPGAGEVVVSIKACGINSLDTLIIRDLYQVKPPRPFAPGCGPRPPASRRRGNRLPGRYS